ncbi:hypothetical protein V8E36_004761 [Tilletia maclaganii]
MRIASATSAASATASQRCPSKRPPRSRRRAVSTFGTCCLFLVAVATTISSTAAQQVGINATASGDPVSIATREELEAICASLVSVIPPMMQAGAAPSRETIQLDHVFTKYYPTGYNLPSHELFDDLLPGTLLPTDDAKGSIRASGHDWNPEGVIADQGYGYESDVQTQTGGLPSFCRFGASIITSPISQVYMEVWLPLPDTEPTNTTDPDPTPYDGSGSGSGGTDDSEPKSPAFRMTEPAAFQWLRRRSSAISSWFGDFSSTESAANPPEDEPVSAATLAARRPPANFIPAPDQGWRGGRMIHIGSAAAKGAIIWPNMKQILSRYREVVVADNSGHFSSAISQSWAADNDPTRRDSGYRAVHLSTMVGQVVTKTFYGVTPGQQQQQQWRRRRRRGLHGAGAIEEMQRRSRAHGGGEDRSSSPTTALQQSAPTSSSSSAPTTGPEDGDYSDVRPFRTLTRPYSNRLGFNSYFLGCSMGGRQALSEAALYPADYDGILAGSPAIAFTNTSAWQIWVNEKVSDPKAPDYIPVSAYGLIRDAVVRACDGLDGVLDGVISNTTACSFDLFAPSLACASPAKLSGATPAKDCFTLAQLANLEGIYSNYTIGPDLVHTGLLPGSEEAWSAMLGLTGEPFGVAPNFFQYQVLNLTGGPSAASFNPFRDVTADVIALGNALDPGRTNTWYPNLTPFLTHGKLLHTHGLADQLIPPGQSVVYYQEVAQRVAHGDLEILQDSYRLFLVPGMAHCRQGDGPWNFGGAAQTDRGARPLLFDPQHDATLALFAWAENNTAPAYLVGANYRTKEEAAGYEIQTGLEDDRRFEYGVKNTRKLCPWPAEAYLKANATKTGVAASFVCQ